MMSRFASKIRRHCCASPYSRCAILERLSPLTTTYVRVPVCAVVPSVRDVGAVDELPLRMPEKSGRAEVLSFMPQRDHGPAVRTMHRKGLFGVNSEDGEGDF